MNFKSRASYKLIILITFFAGFLRFSHLSTNPPALNLDEVAIGYNAYSVLKTGMDEYGTRFPITFRSHDDYKAPLYIYLTTIPIYFFGLNPFAVRFVSALAGTLTIPMLYFLTRLLFSSHKHSLALAQVSSLILAISPWHLQFSRAAYETNLSLFFVVFGLWAYLKGKHQPKYWFLTAIAFALSIYAYHSAKIVIPLFALVLIFDSHRAIIKHKTHSLLVAITFISLVLPLIPFSLTPAGRLRFKGTSVFETPTLIDISRQQKIEEWRQGRVVEAFLFHDSRMAAAMVLLKGYFSHFTFHFLFLGENGPPRDLTPNVGLLYLWELPFIIYGAVLLGRQKGSSRLIIFFWLLLSFVPSAFTWDAPSSTRTLLAVPTFSLLTATGLSAFIFLNRRFLVRAALGAVIIFFFFDYLHNSYRIAPLVYADSWQYGYRQAVEYASVHQQQYQHIVVSTNLRQPQNFFAFYLKYDPLTYINIDGGTVSGGFNEDQNHFGIYQFHPISWNQADLNPHTLYIDLAAKIPDQFKPQVVIDLPDGTPQIGIYAKD